jgi:hypothetical protein
MYRTEVDMDIDVAQEQLQRMPTDPQHLTAETIELIQCAHSYVVEHHGVQCTLEKLRRQKASALKVCERW